MIVAVSIEELSQLLFPARTLDPFDLLAGYAGISAFSYLALRLSPALRKHEAARSK